MMGLGSLQTGLRPMAGQPCASLGKHTREGGRPRMWAGHPGGPTRGFGVMHLGVQAVVGPMRFVWMVYSLRSDIPYVVHLSRVTLSCPRAVTTYRT